MKRFQFPLRFSIPIILLLFGSLLGLFSFEREVYLSYLRTEEDASHQARFAANQTSGILEYLYRNGDIEEAEIIISQIGGGANVRLALLCDEKNRVLLATNYQLKNQLLDNITADIHARILETVRQTLSGQVVLSKDKQSLWAIYPVSLGSATGEIRPSKVGLMLLEYDVSGQKDQTYRDALGRSLEFIAVLALLCTIVWILFDQSLTQRVVQLVSATNRLAKGDFTVRATLQGADELTQIAAAFNKMVSQIESHQHQLQKLAMQRQELLNLLASQISNSLELDTILRTAVSETRNLLEVDRCNSIWCYFDTQLPYFDLSYEAKLTDLPSVLGQYPIGNLQNSSYIKAILKWQVVKINDLATDTFLDTALKERFIAQGYKSFIAYPISIHSGKIGLICCAYCHKLHQWSDEEIELLQSVANQLAIAIEQAELYTQTHQAAVNATEQAEQLKQTLHQLQQTQALLHATLDSTADGILVVDRDGKIAGFNQKFVQMWGMPESIVAAKDDEQAINFVLEQLTDAPAFVAKIKELYAQINVESYDVLKFKDGKTFERYSQPQRLDGQIVGRVWSFRDITERSQAEEKIRYQALHDLLTDLPNRVLFSDRLSLALANAHRHAELLCVMFLDLDRFKIINDTLGHAVGDELLQAVAQRLTECLREGDTVARWGGDEFTLLLPEICDAKDAAKVAHRILEVLKPTFNLQEHCLHISSSIGMALYPDDGEDAETLLKNADAALYRAKEQGRNNYQFYTSTINSQASELLILENHLHYALSRGEFVVFYQPQVNINTWKITRMEALLRWQHPDLGLISPGMFIPIAEENGLILPIGEWVLRTACAQNQAWQDMGLSPLRVAVNLSGRQFQQPHLLDIVGNILAETGLPAECLELEITETVAMRDVDFTKTVLSELQQMGVCISLDDFGTGYSSLNYLKKFPFHTIKIDRSFIHDLPIDPYDRAIATAVITLGHGLNMSVVAEGVETQAQLDCLRSLHCQEMQGYFFSRPLSSENATQMLIQNSEYRIQNPESIR